jgi:hypothetical protein
VVNVLFMSQTMLRGSRELAPVERNDPFAVSGRAAVEVGGRS